MVSRNYLCVRMHATCRSLLLLQMIDDDVNLMTDSIILGIQYVTICDRPGCDFYNAVVGGVLFLVNDSEG